MYVAPSTRIADVSRVTATALASLVMPAHQAGVCINWEPRLQPRLHSERESVGTNGPTIALENHAYDIPPGIALAVDERRAKHSAAEQKQRTNTRLGYDRLTAAVFALRDHDHHEGPSFTDRLATGTTQGSRLHSDAHFLSQSKLIPPLLKVIQPLSVLMDQILTVLEYTRDQLDVPATLLVCRRALRTAIAQSAGIDITIHLNQPDVPTAEAEALEPFSGV